MHIDDALWGDGGRLPATDSLTRSRAAYVDRWAVNAAAYAAQGLYRQLAERLAQHIGGDRLVDLGCGPGDGMAAIREALPTASLRGVDENPACLAAAAGRFSLPVPIHRLWPTRGDIHDLSYAHGSLPSGMLVHSDLLRPDKALAAMLGRIDAFTLWFPGTHSAREHDRVVRRHRLTTDEHYVVAVELAAIRLATAHLATGGCLHIVDRAAHPDPATIAAAFRHRFAAMTEGTPLCLIELAVIPYREPGSGPRIAVHSLAPHRRRLPTAAVSAIFRRGERINARPVSHSE